MNETSKAVPIQSAIHRVLAFSILLLASLVLASPAVAYEMVFYEESSAWHNLKYTDTSLPSALEGPAGSSEWDLDIFIHNRGAYVVDDLRLIQHCWSVNKADEIVVREAGSDKRGPNIAVWGVAHFVASERNKGMNCTYTIRAWIQGGKSHDFTFQDNKNVYLRGGVNTPYIDTYSQEAVGCDKFEDNTGCRQWSSKYERPGRVGVPAWLEASLVSVHSDKCLDVSKASSSNGANVYQYECLGKDNQIMYMAPVAEKSDVYMLMFKHSAKCLDVSGGSGNGANLHQYSCHAGTNQQFKLTPAGNGSYFLIAEHSGKFLDVKGHSTKNEGNIHQWTQNGLDNQQWRLKREDYYHFTLNPVFHNNTTTSWGKHPNGEINWNLEATAHNGGIFEDDALQLDGVDDYAVMSDYPYFDIGPDDDFTVSVWIKANALQADIQYGSNDVVSKYSDDSGRYPFAIRYRNQNGTNGDGDNGKVVVLRYDGANTPGIKSQHPINDGQFHHVAFIKQGETLKLYVDGQLNGETTDTTTGPTGNTSPLYLGKRGFPNSPNYFKGALDELRIYSYAITPAELGPLLLTTTTFSSITLLSAHNKYVVAETDGRMDANRTTAGDYEHFSLIPNADGTVSFVSYHGTFVSAQPDGSLDANRTAIGPWEKFTRIDNSDNTVSFQSDHGLYVKATPAGNMFANANQIGPWEKFQLGTDF